MIEIGSDGPSRIFKPAPIQKTNRSKRRFERPAAVVWYENLIEGLLRDRHQLDPPILLARLRSIVAGDAFSFEPQAFERTLLPLCYRIRFVRAAADLRRLRRFLRPATRRERNQQHGDRADRRILAYH